MTAPTRGPRQDAAGSIYPSIYYDDAYAAMDFLERAFGYARRLVVPGPDQTVRHAELSMGGGVIMVGTVRESREPVRAESSPRRTHGLCVYVEDPDQHCAHARAHGAHITREPKDEEYGARGYMCEDLEGNAWYFGDYRPGAYWQD